MKFKKILLTGADGFIGSHLAEYLVQQGFQVKAMAVYNSMGSWGWLDTLPVDVRSAMEVCLGDVRDYGSVQSAIKGCDGVLHLAALIGIPYSYHAPFSYIDTNIKGTLNILQAARDFDLQKIVLTSTSEVYGSATTVPMTEDHRLLGQSPYSASKIGADQMGISFHRSFASPVSIVRPFNTYGPRQSARAIIPVIISQIVRKNHKIELGSLHPTRDLNYVGDIVRGFTQALIRPESIGEVINLGTGFEISVKDLALTIAELMDKNIEIVSSDDRIRPELSEVDRLCADASKAKNLLKWEPEKTGLEGLKSGLRATIDWFSKEDNLKYYRTGYAI